MSAFPRHWLTLHHWPHLFYGIPLKIADFCDTPDWAQRLGNAPSFYMSSYLRFRDSWASFWRSASLKGYYATLLPSSNDPYCMDSGNS